MPDLATLLLWAFWTSAGVFVGFHVAITAAIRDVERWEYENRMRHND